MLLVSPARINDVEDYQPVRTKLFTKHIVAQHATVIMDIGVEWCVSKRKKTTKKKHKDSKYEA